MKNFLEVKVMHDFFLNPRIVSPEKITIRHENILVYP